MPLLALFLSYKLYVVEIVTLNLSQTIGRGSVFSSADEKVKFGPSGAATLAFDSGVFFQ